MPGHILYRGEERHKEHGHGLQPTPVNKREYFLWFVLGLVGILILWLAISLSARTLAGFFIFIIYLMFLLVVTFAFRDAKKIKPMKHHEDDSDGLLEDYLAQVEWKQIHRYSRMPEPKWRYRPVIAKGESGNLGCSILIIPIVVFGLAIASISYFGANSPITILAIVIIGIISIFAFLIIQSSRD